MAVSRCGRPVSLLVPDRFKCRQRLEKRTLSVLFISFSSVSNVAVAWLHGCRGTMPTPQSTDQQVIQVLADMMCTGSMLSRLFASPHTCTPKQVGYMHVQIIKQHTRAHMWHTCSPQELLPTMRRDQCSIFVPALLLALTSCCLFPSK